MKNRDPFIASIQVPLKEYGRIVTDRVACRRQTCILGDPPENCAALTEKRQYRLHLVEALMTACASSGYISVSEPRDILPPLVRKFVNLGNTLGISKALAFPHGATLCKDYADVAEPGDESEELRLIESEPEAQGFKINDDTIISTMRESLAHPLLVALVAYHLGGPVNAAFTIRSHEWKLSEVGLANKPVFHIEGDTGVLFDDIRVTTAWEVHDKLIAGPSGEHSIFLTDDAEPRTLATPGPIKDDQASSPLCIIYNSRHATLYYDCQDLDAIRKSVSLDFHLNTITNDDIQLLSNAEAEPDDENLTLSKLITTFPVKNYTDHFNRLLFTSESPRIMLDTLSTLDVSEIKSAPDQRNHKLQQRFEMFKKENLTRIPPAILSMAVDIPLLGSYKSSGGFLDSVYIKARRDVHLPIGHDLFPQTEISEGREWTRKFIRDLPEDLISRQLAKYAQIVKQCPYTAGDLLTTATLRKLAIQMEQRCLELIGIGFIDKTGHLPSVAALALAFGRAIDGPKEVHVTPEPWIDGADLQIYRTRCLYLFWCADWLVCFLVKPTDGPFMMLETRRIQEDLIKVRAQMIRIARLLLRNWVAWGLFMEELPQSGFHVRHRHLSRDTITAQIMPPVEKSLR